MKPVRVSAQDVAERAGVSRTTVSFVLNNSPGKSITEETRRRVLLAARELGYEPNQDARRLAMVRSSSIGLLITHSQYVYSDVFISRVIEGMSQAVNRNRIQLIIQPLRFEDHGYLPFVRDSGVSGVILINTRDNDPGIDELIEARVPSVSIDYMEHTAIDQVYVDNRGAAREIVKMALDWGHREVAMITHAPLEFSASRRRLEGYRQALTDFHLPYREDRVHFGNFSENSGYEAMASLLSEQQLPTVVFAGNDIIAYGALAAARDKGFRVPEDISVVGFDDDYLSRYTNPPLTTVALPASGLGNEAVNLLLQRIRDRQAAGAEDSIQNPRVAPRRIVLPTHISVRRSCLRLKDLSD